MCIRDRGSSAFVVIGILPAHKIPINSHAAILIILFLTIKCLHCYIIADFFIECNKQKAATEVTAFC